MTESRLRFLKAIAERVNPERVAELRLFRSIRQGGVETAVAVVAIEGDDAGRCSVLAARYRWTLKGPDRGKWEFDLVHEADAPLDAVERVASGVARRAGDDADPDHFTGVAFREALEEPPWATTP
jgi:hypothetical protein